MTAPCLPSRRPWSSFFSDARARGFCARSGRRPRSSRRRSIRSGASHRALLLAAWLMLPVAAAHAESKICESYRENYAREQQAIDRMRHEPYKSNRQRALDEKRARLESQCADGETFASGSRAPLRGGVDEAVLTGGVETTVPGAAPVLRPLTPMLDPRGADSQSTAHEASRSTGDVNGRLLPTQNQPRAPATRPDTGGRGSGHAGDASRTSTSVSGRIVGMGRKTPPGDGSGGSGAPGDGPGGSGTPSDDQVRDTARRLSTETAAPAAGGATVNTPFTRSYFYTQGVLHGLLDGASEASGAMARTQVAAYYLMTGRPVQAERMLGYTGRDSVIRDMQRDLEDWQTATTSTTNPFNAYDNGRTAGRLLGKTLTQQFTDRVGHAGHLPAPPDAAVSPPAKRDP